MIWSRYKGGPGSCIKLPALSPDIPKAKPTKSKSGHRAEIFQGEGTKLHEIHTFQPNERTTHSIPVQWESFALMTGKNDAEINLTYLLSEFS
jgi:hypothetical protein